MTFSPVHAETHDIVSRKRQQLQMRQAKTPTAAVIALAEMQRRPFPVLNYVTGGEMVTLIGQVTYAETYDPVGASLKFVRAGVDAVAFFTDRLVYPTGLDDLLLVSRGVKRPVISQDFVLNEYHVTEFRAAGAAALTLYASVLEPVMLRRAVSVTQRWRMAAVVQVANDEHLALAAALSPHVIAVGDPDIPDPDHDLHLLEHLRPLIPRYAQAMPLHALTALAQVRAALDLSVDALIVGDDLVATPDRAAQLLALVRPNAAQL
jgi:indole-3-glycerol phosphate synthase